MISLVAEWKMESEEIRPNVFIPSKKADPAFNRDVRILIEQVESNPIGRRLLEKIRLCRNHSFNGQGAGEDQKDAANPMPANADFSACFGIVFIVPGKKDECLWVHEHKYRDAKIIPPVIVGLSLKDGACFSTTGDSIPSPKHVVLFHELTHAYHNLSGRRATTDLCDPLVWASDEEYKTVVGFPSKKGKTTPKITENAFRKAEGLPERFGSWCLSDDDLRAALCAARIKVLGAIHIQKQLVSPENFTPPSLTICSIHDLGLANRCALLAEIEEVETVGVLKMEYRTFLWIDLRNSLNSAMEEACYIRPPNESLESEQLKNLVTEYFPRLKNSAFKIRSLVFLRLSQQEVDVVLSSKDYIKEKGDPPREG